MGLRELRRSCHNDCKEPLWHQVLHTLQLVVNSYNKGQKDLDQGRLRGETADKFMLLNAKWHSFAILISRINESRQALKAQNQAHMKSRCETSHALTSRGSFDRQPGLDSSFSMCMSLSHKPSPIPLVMVRVVSRSVHTPSVSTVVRTTNGKTYISPTFSFCVW